MKMKRCYCAVAMTQGALRTLEGGMQAFISNYQPFSLITCTFFYANILETVELAIIMKITSIMSECFYTVC